MNDSSNGVQKQQKVRKILYLDLLNMWSYSNNKRHLEKNPNTFIRKNSSRIFKIKTLS
jgi:hypothetical protein